MKLKYSTYCFICKCLSYIIILNLTLAYIFYMDTRYETKFMLLLVLFRFCYVCVYQLALWLHKIATGFNETSTTLPSESGGFNYEEEGLFFACGIVNNAILQYNDMKVPGCGV